jgi:hypothetical protein
MLTLAKSVQLAKFYHYFYMNSEVKKRLAPNNLYISYKNYIQ